LDFGLANRAGESRMEEVTGKDRDCQNKSKAEKADLEIFNPKSQISNLKSQISLS
jgi:hypothetical protein